MAFLDEELSPKDLTNSHDKWNQYSRQHCNNHPPGMVTGFEWKDYSPKTFRLIQELENIDNDDYMMLVCSDETITKVTSTSRHGNMFLFSNDARFAIKTLRKSEVKVLLEMLPDYYNHVKKFRNTILNKLYGVHLVKPAGGAKVYFVVVANIFKSDFLMHRCYDLKGSLKGRKMEKLRYQEKILHKDSDLDFLFYIDPLVRQRLLKQIEHDCAFLEAAGIMDYSLMLGLHVKESPKGCDNICSNNGMTVFNVALHQSDLASQRSSASSYQDSITDKSSSASTMDIFSRDSFQDNEESELSFGDHWIENNGICCKFGEELSARGVRISKPVSGSTLSRQNFSSMEFYDVLLCFGIVDFFHNYGVIKRIEHAYKSLQFDKKMISAVNPKVYSSRFQEFIGDIFKEDESLE